MISLSLLSSARLVINSLNTTPQNDWDYQEQLSQVKDFFDNLEGLTSTGFSDLTMKKIRDAQNLIGREDVREKIKNIATLIIENTGDGDIVSKLNDINI